MIIFLEMDHRICRVPEHDLLSFYYGDTTERAIIEVPLSMSSFFWYIDPEGRGLSIFDQKASNALKYLEKAEFFWAPVDSRESDDAHMFSHLMTVLAYWCRLHPDAMIRSCPSYPTIGADDTIVDPSTFDA